LSYTCPRVKRKVVREHFPALTFSSLFPKLFSDNCVALALLETGIKKKVLKSQRRENGMNPVLCNLTEACAVYRN
jgi:hypothetical protein